MFSESFFYAVILTGLTWTGIGAAVLIVLLLVDWARGKLW